MSGRLDADDVRAAPWVDVLDRFGVTYRDQAEIRLPVCLLCGKRRVPFLVDPETGDHSGPDAGGSPCKSGIFGLTAELADPAELAPRRAEPQVRMETSAQQAATERSAAEALVPALRAERERRHPRGERRRPVEGSSGASEALGRFTSQWSSNPFAIRPGHQHAASLLP